MHNAKRFIGVTLLILVLVLSVACSTVATSESNSTSASTTNLTSEASEVDLGNELVSHISTDRMVETVRLLSATDNARIAGFDGEAGAADYIKNQLQNLGLETTEQSFPMKAYAALNTSLEIVSPENQLIEEAKALSYSLGTDAEGITAEVVNIGLGANEDYAYKDVTGKFVLISRGGEYFYLKAERATQKGAVGAIFYDPNSEGAISATLTHLSKIPAVSIAPTSAESIIKSLLSDEVITVHLKMEITHKDATSKNIISVYPSANNPEGKTVIVGAHYDGVDTPAANDNASGTSVLLEIAKILKEQKVELPFDVKFIAFGAEEIGLVGSNDYASQMQADEKNATVAMLNFDMVGVGSSFEISTAGGRSASQLATLATDELEKMGLSSSVSEKDNSDHSSFSYNGVSAILIEAGPFKAYHTDKDTIDVIEPPTLSNSCELGIRLLVEALPKQFK